MTKEKNRMENRCIECGAELESNASFCSYCGARQPQIEKDSKLEKEKLIADLEHADTVAYRIVSNKDSINKFFNELEKLDIEKLESKAEGYGTTFMKTAIVVGIIVLAIVVIGLFKKVGIIAAVIGFFVVKKIIDMILELLLKINNEINKEEVKKYMQEYESQIPQKEELEKKMEECHKIIKELEEDIVYQKYSYLLEPTYANYKGIPLGIINALKDGKAENLEEAIKYKNYKL